MVRTYSTHLKMSSWGSWNLEGWPRPGFCHICFNFTSQVSGNLYPQQNIYIYIYLFIYYTYTVSCYHSWHITTPGKETRRKQQRKNELGQKAKPSTSTQAIEACMGEEEKNRKQKEEKKGIEIGNGAPAQLPGPFGCLLQPTWIIQWAYSETPPTHRGISKHQD